MTFEGKVEEIVYANEETGYTVLNFSTDDTFFTAVGSFPMIAEGELLRITGEFKTNGRFGEQFVVDRVEFYKPDNLEGIIKYLSCGLFKGIREKLAMQIVNYFGLDTLDILENAPERLAEISGIGKKKLSDIIRSYNESRKMKEAILFLQKYDISMALAVKIYKQYQKATVSIVQDNPYRLVEDIDGVGFVTADKIASKMGIDRHSPFRIRAGILHTLRDGAISGGHTCLPKADLLTLSAKLLGVGESECAENLGDLDVKQLNVDGTEIVATKMNFDTENAIAAKLIKLSDSANDIDLNIEKELADYENSHGITLDKRQKEAITSVFAHGVTVITGGPGTGKTTIIKGVTTVMRQRHKKVLLSAPTGRACKRIFEATGEDAKTLHRLLGIGFNEKNCFDETNPLHVDVLIVDEISMADIYIFNALLKALPTGVRLVLVGDKDQLPSVSCGNILSDVIGSGLIATVYLTDVHRQSEGSCIVTNAHRINNGQMPIWKGTQDFFFIRKDNPRDIISEVVGLVKRRLPSYLDLTPNDIQVLAPMKKSLIGVENLNTVLQSALNPHGEEKTFKNGSFRVGDRVMQTMNDYQLNWRKDNGEVGEGVFNGDLGTVVRVGKDGLVVYFEDGKTAVYSASESEEIMLAYCVSVHKSQGSEFPVVVLVLGGSGSYTLMTRNLLYTAVTRAKRTVVVVGSEEGLKKMVDNTYTAKRYSLLKHLLLKNQRKYTLLWGSGE